MKTPSFLEGALLAAIFAVCGEVIFSVLPWFFNRWETQVVVITLMSLAYMLYLLRRAPERTGRVSFIVIWVFLSLGALGYGLPTVLYLLLQLGCIWLTRTVYFRAGLFGALADLGLHALATSAAVWAFSRSGSVLLSLWSFFLVEALFPLWPGYQSQSTNTNSSENLANPRFEQAHRTALAALHRMTIH